MDSDKFDGITLALDSPTIDAIFDTILTMDGRVTLAKIDVARAFRNLRADPADAVRLWYQLEGQ